MAIIPSGKLINGKGIIRLETDTQFLTIGHCKKVELKIEVKKTPYTSLGDLAEGQKYQGWRGTGTISMYQGTKEMINIAYDYIKTGKKPEFSIFVVNDDPTSSIERQEVRADNCSLNDILIAMVDTDATILTRESAFTFTGFEILKHFKD